MDLSQFDYDLPESLIAQSPAASRTQSRLLHVADQLHDMQFTQLSDLLNPGDLVVLNNTKVMAARLMGNKPSGGKVKIMLERITGETTALVQLKSNKSMKDGQQIIIVDGVSLIVLERIGTFFSVEFSGLPVKKVLQQYGELPLPPYIKRNSDETDESRYQTVYAKQTGAVAAPTAGLHFDELMLKRLKNMGVELCELTLHVGAGTFQPVRVDDITQHKMHKEYYSIDQGVINQIKLAGKEGGKIIAVGTTTVRALESAYGINTLEEPISAETDMFIYPGFQFQVVDVLVTNFHLPKSTLLMMVSAFGGYDKVIQAYQHAIESEYRFFSYGDGMFLEREQ